MLELPSFFASGDATLPFLPELVALLGIGALIAFVCQRFGLVPIVGFLLAGVLIGPNALGLVHDLDSVNAAAEVGIILLLFTIGIEFSLEKLARIQRFIFGGGGLQVGLTVAITALVLWLFHVPWNAAIFTGFLIALSSTAIVLKLLAERRETDSPAGQVSLGILIFQDLAIIVMVLLIPMLSGKGGSGGGLDILWALAKAGGIIALVLLVARRVMPKILEIVARTCSPEVFLLTVIAICFGTAYLTSLAGVSLSLGAFLAGLIVSESRFSHHAFGEIMPLQILFSATFFVSVGMLLDVRFLIQHPLLVLIGLAAVVLVKVIAAGASVLALRYPPRVAIFAGLLLAQIGEFSFVLERAGSSAGLFPAGMENGGGQAFIAATVLLMALTPVLAQAGTKAADWLGARDQAKLAATGADATAADGSDGSGVEGEAYTGEGHVIIAGYGQAARPLARALRDAEIPHVILTLSPHGANEAEREGLKVIRGDYSRSGMLALAGVNRARTLVIADDDAGRTQSVVSVARNANPDMRIIARTRLVAQAESILHEGANEVIAEEEESTVQLFQHVLTAHEVPGDHIAKKVGRLRENGYAAMRETPSAIPEGGEGESSLVPQTAASAAGAVSRGPVNCSHLDQIRPVEPDSEVCDECRALGDKWVHLRICLTCGHVACCDSSKHRHARHHFETTGHAIMASYEPGETWRWCFIDEIYV